MIKFKLETNKKQQPILKMGIKPRDLEKYKFLKRSLMDGKKLEGTYNYEVPLRYFIPIFNNIPVENIKFDKKSVLSYLEFSDEFDDKYYYTLAANSRYMKLWREEKCPNIYKVTINPGDLTLEKEVVFKKVKLGLG